MSWVTVIWSMVASACLTLALLHFWVWFKNRQARANLAFAVAAVAVAGVDAAELLVMHARTPEAIAAAMRWLDVPMFVLVAALVGFVRLNFRTVRPWLGWTAVVLRFFSLILNFTSGTTDNYREITAVRQMDFLGEPVSVVAQAVTNPWGHVSELSMLFLLVFVTDAAIRLWRVGGAENQRQPWVIGGSLAGFIVVAAGFSALIENQIIHWPYLISLPFLAIVLVMNHELSRDVVHAAQLSDDLQERLRFETLLTDISSKFVNLPASEVDREILDAQRRICNLLDLDLSAIWQWSDEVPGIFRLTHFCGVVEGPQPPERMSAQEHFPWFQQQMLAGRIVAISSPAEMPAEAARDQVTFRQFNIKSALVIPLSVGGAPPIGILGLNTTRTQRGWPDALVQRLQLVAQIFANALARKHADQALRESEERMSLAADAAGAGLWILHLKTSRFWLTKKTWELFGLAPEADLALERFLNLVHPDDRELVRETIQTVVQSKSEASVEYRAVGSGSDLRWMSSHGRVQLDAAGEPERLMGVTVDVTPRKLAEEKLRQLSLAVEQSPVLITITDKQGKIVYVNRKFSEVTGYSLEECLGQNPRILKSGESSPKVYEELWATITGGKTWRGEFHNRKKNGELYWESAVISPILDAGLVTHFVGIKEDITEHKRAESEITRQRNELTHLSRVTTLSTLSSSLAHELNQPLGIILSNAQAAQELLAQDPPVVAEVSEILTDIVAADRRAAEVIQRLRALMKRGETSRQPLRINDLLEEVLQLVQADFIGRGVTPVCNLASDLPLIIGDQVQLQQLALNLILNAADAMAANAPGRRRLQLTTTRRGQNVRASVRDEGAGLPADVEQLFQPFFTTKAHGLGMGLAICRSIITAHHGRLWAEPHPERGAVFQFELPIADSPNHP